MKIREVTIYLYFIVFLLGLSSGISIRGTQEALIFVFYVLIGVCGIILASWVNADGEEIKRLRERGDNAYESHSELRKDVEALLKRINELEKRLEKEA